MPIHIDAGNEYGRSAFIRRPRVAYQDGDLFLIDTGHPVPGKPAVPDLLDLREGRVYDRAADRLELQHGPPLPVGSYLSHGEWQAVTLTADQVAEIETHVAALIAANRRHRSRSKAAPSGRSTA